MLKIRLKRVGRKHDPSFRIVVTEHTAPAKGGYLESIGFYNAAQKQLQLDKERAAHWISNGAQPSPVVHNILVREGVLNAPKIQVHNRPVKKEEEVVAEEAATPAEGATDAEVAEEAPLEETATEEVSVEETPATAEEVVAEEAPASADATEEAPKEEGEK
ncbi:MAG: 30S ribosomal protein S16 [Candidatus Spechtbacterales bacterium]